MNMDNIMGSDEQKPEVNAEAKKRKFVSKRKAIIIAAVIVIAGLAYHYKGLLIAATVNGVPISRLAVINQLEKTSGKSTLDLLITQMLVSNEAKKKGITVTNDEIDTLTKNISDQIKTQGSTLEAALAAQGMTTDDFRKEIIFQKEIEKLLADKLQVSDSEIDKYIADNKITVPAGQEANYRSQISSQLRQQKLSTEASSLISSLKSQAKINYFVNY